MLVAYKSRLQTIMQRFNGRESYYAFQDIHEGLKAIQDAVEGLRISHETPRGAADGTNTMFRVSNQPSMVTVNGVVQDFKYNNGVVTLASPPASGASVTSLYLDSGSSTGPTSATGTGGGSGGGGGGTGTVTSVGLSMPPEFNVSGSPVTSSGVLTATKANEAAGTVWSGPTSGAAAAPGFRALVASDIPNIAESQVINLVSDLALKAPLASPVLTGTPTAPTQATADNSTDIATTAFVKSAIAASPLSIGNILVNGI